MYRKVEGRRKGSTLYVQNNFEYRKNRTTANGHVYLICTTPDCPGRAILREDQMEGTTEHNHPPLSDQHFSVNKGKFILAMLRSIFKGA
jgi:hypothetical protein